MIDRFLLQVLVYLPVVFAHMLRIPPIASTSILTVFIAWETCRSSFQCHISRAHYCLSDVFKAVIDVPWHFDRIRRHWRGDHKFHGIVRAQYGVKTVKLMRYGCGEDGMIWVVVYRGGEVGVLRGSFDIDIAQALYRACQYFTTVKDRTKSGRTWYDV